MLKVASIKFKAQKVSQRRITTPFYRVVCPAMYGNNNGNPLGPNSYWTPRWKGIKAMLNAIFRNYIIYRKSHTVDEQDGFKTKIYEITEAIMQDPPSEHSWSFRYNHDAGEQILVQAIQPPKLLYDIHPSDQTFQSFIEDIEEPDIDYSKDNEKRIWNGQEVFLSTDYQKKCITVAKKNSDGWSYSILKEIRSLPELIDFENQCKNITDPYSSSGALDYFLMDVGWINNNGE